MVERPSVRPSVCPVNRQHQPHAAGLLLGEPRGQEISLDSTGARRSAATAPTVLGTARSSKCGQCHVHNRGTRLNTDYVGE